jgi:hypothetical protein
VFSRIYAAVSACMDERGMGALRTELLASLTGSVVDVDAATAATSAANQAR